MSGKGRALVTGAGGFVGSHLVELLVAEGYQVRAMLRYTSQGSEGNIGNLRDLPKDVVDGVEILYRNIEDTQAVEKAIEGCDLVFHLAALIGIPYSYRAPQQYVATNVLGTLNVLDGSRKAQVRRTICISTSEVYGTARYTPIDEEHPLQAQSPYAATKIGAEKLAQSYGLSFGLPVLNLRPFNIYGPRQSTRAVIPTIITQILREPCIKLGSLDPIRDFNFVKDTVRGMMMAAEGDFPPGDVMNIGSGTSVTIGQVVERVQALCGTALPIETDPERIRPKDSEVLELKADATRAREVLGWKPQYDLDRGLQETIAWFRDHPDVGTGTEYAI